jgi:predicted alpha/beta hydrolase family esterase
MPTTRFPVDDNWHNLVDELIHHLEQQPEPVWGVGHSLGGVLHLHAACVAQSCIAAW